MKTGTLLPQNLTASQAILTNASKQEISADYLDQAVKQASSPTYAGLTLTGFSGIILASAGVLSTIAYTDWTTPSYNAANFTGNGSMTWGVDSGDVETYSYCIIGKTMQVRFFLNTTTVGGSLNTALQIAIPASKTCSGDAPFMYGKYQGTWSMACGLVTNGATVISLFTDLTQSGNWSASTNTTYVKGQVFFPIS
jgi:hypothetical protein